MKNNTREIFYAWKEFLNEGETKSSLLSENFSNNFKQDKISEIKSLVEWGDKLEEFINENVEIRLLETHYLNEGLWADFKRSKDNVKNKIKNFFTQGWTKDKRDADGNIVKSDLNDEESAAVQELTSKSKAVINVLLAVKLATIILGSASLGAGTTSNVDSSKINNKPAIVQVAQNATDIPGATQDDFETAEKVVEMPMEEIIGELPPEVVVMPVETIIGKVKESAAEHVAKQTGESKEDILKKIQDDPEVSQGFQDLINSEAFKDDARRGEATGYGLDADGSYSLHTRFTDDNQDMTRANTAVQKMADKASFDGLLTGQEIVDELRDTDMDEGTLNDRIQELSKDQLRRLVTAAKLYTIKQLKSRNPDLFKNGSEISIKQTSQEGGNTGDQDSQFSSSHGHFEGTDEAKVLFTMYNVIDLSSGAYNLDEINTIGKLKSELNQGFSNKNISQDSSMPTQARNDFIGFISANVGSDDVDLDQALDNNNGFNVDLKIMTSKLTTAKIKSGTNTFDQGVQGTKGARKLGKSARKFMPSDKG